MRLDAAKIVAAALTELESGRGDFSMRGIASALQVDPMALYYYFSSKEALADAVVESKFASLATVAKRVEKETEVADRVYVLAYAYLRCIAPMPQLTRYLARRGAPALQARFSELFSLAVRKEVESGSELESVCSLLVDYLHGIAIAGQKAALGGLKEGWPILMRGLLASIQ